MQGAPSAHPVTSHPHVDVPVLLVALGLAAVVVLAATVVPTRPRVVADSQLLGTTSWWGSLSRPQWLVRGASVAALVVAMVAARVGVDDELENLAPALTVGAGWPLLVAGGLALGTLWRWVDPWDTLARWIPGTDSSLPSEHVLPAVVIATGWWWFLAAYPRPLDPRSVGIALVAYTAITLAGCVAVGRVRWLSSAEPIGLTLAWVGLVPRRRLGAWQPPRGAAVLMGVGVGGAVFASVRRTELWSGFAASSRADLYSAGALLLACAVGGGLTALVHRSARSAEQRAAVTRALVPATAGLVLAVALARNRFFTSVQLLPGLVGDPLGRGWDLMGSTTGGLDPSPLGAAGLVTLQLGVIAVMHLAAAVLAPRPLVGDERLLVIITLSLTAVISVTAVSLH